MFALLKILHVLALVFGSVASLGQIYLLLSAGPHDLAAPGFTTTLRKFYKFTGVSAVTVLWVTGLLLLFGRYGLWIDGFAFNAKIALVVLLSLSILFINVMTPGWVRKGGPPSYLKTLHWFNAVLLLAIVVFAVVAFG